MFEEKVGEDKRKNIWLFIGVFEVGTEKDLGLGQLTSLMIQPPIRCTMIKEGEK